MQADGLMAYIQTYIQIEHAGNQPLVSSP
jgi:hypothetical protein